MITLGSGTLPYIEPINPSKYTCYYCQNRKANGNLWDAKVDKTRWVCSYCYKHILFMRPIMYEKTEINLKRDLREAMKTVDQNSWDDLEKTVDRYWEEIKECVLKQNQN